MSTVKLKNTDNPLVSVIIPSYNRCQELTHCLSTLTKQHYQHFEVIIIDDGSTDETVSTIKENFSYAQLIENKVNKGLNYSRNIGTLQSKGEYLLFLDSDVEVTNPDLIANMVQIAKKRNDLGGLGAFYYDESGPQAMSFNWEKEIIFDLPPPALLQQSKFICGCCLFVRKQLLLDHNGFDEFIIGDSTEAEMGLSFSKNGYTNLFGPSVAIKHNESPTERHNLGNKNLTTKVSLQERLLWGRKNRFRYYIKNQGIASFLYLFFHLLLTEDSISLLAFIKQQFFGLKKENSESFPSLDEKMYHFRFLIRRIYEPILWNLCRLSETYKSKTINFLEYEK